MFLDLEPFIAIEGDMGIFHTASVEARFLFLARARSVQEIGSDAPENGSAAFSVFRENSGARSADKPHAGGPARGLFLLLTAPAKDLVIPGADYSFGQLQLALTRGNFESLGRQRRPVIRLHLVRGLNKA